MALTPSANQGVLCLTSRHGKERALARPFRQGLGWKLVTCACDTDQLGTFSGDVERPADALETCRRKARLGLEQTGLVVGLASEGSFGPHPAAPLLPVGQELLLLIDLERGLEYVETRLELRTNFGQQVFGPDQDPSAWLRHVGFPSHAVIARPANWKRGASLYTGLRSDAELRAAIDASRKADPQGRVQLETDMRAHLNPTRMASLRRLGMALVRRLRTPCPSCAAPGWGVVDRAAGLPCSWCGEPTELTLNEIWACSQCGARLCAPRRDGRLSADPGQCLNCNP